MTNLIKKHFEINKEAKQWHWFNPEWINNPFNFEFYKANDKTHNWNYIHDIKKSIVYFVPNKSNGCQCGVFGSIEHLKKTYNILN